jgi:cytochrome c peroxidase
MQNGEMTDDLGLYNITGKEDDKYFFKVPPLRNVEKTYPYFHDGKVKTLNDSEVEDIEAFLKTMTGSIK